MKFPPRHARSREQRKQKREEERARIARAATEAEIADHRCPVCKLWFVHGLTTHIRREHPHVLFPR